MPYDEHEDQFKPESADLYEEQESLYEPADTFRERLGEMDDVEADEAEGYDIADTTYAEDTLTSDATPDTEEAFHESLDTTDSETEAESDADKE